MKVIIQGDAEVAKTMETAASDVGKSFSQITHLWAQLVKSYVWDGES